MTDHVEAAEEYVDLVAWGPYEHRNENGYADEMRVAIAQVHATLALVEQQRVANLIDFLAICEARGATDDAYLQLNMQVLDALRLR